MSDTRSGPSEPAPQPVPAGRIRASRLRRRLTWAFLLVAAVSAGTLAAGSYALVSQARMADSLDRAEADARYDLRLARQFVPVDDERATALLTSEEQSGRHVVLVTDGADDSAENTVAASNPAFAPSPPAELRAIAARGEVGFHRLAHDGHRLLLVGGRIPGTADELYLVVVEDALHAELADLGTVLAGGWLAVVVLAALVGHLLARRTLEPVGRASAAATALAEGLLDTRLPVRRRVGRPDEFGAWAESFNSMATALESKITALAAAQARERRFTADVAHELRTPVTALLAEAALLRGHLDALPADVRRPAELLVADVGRLRRLVEELMEIARLDAGAEPVRAEPVDLEQLIAAVLRAGGWTDAVTVAVPDGGVSVHTDPRRLQRVLANLVGNGVVHGGGKVTLTVTRGGGDELLVDVADSGQGIPAEHLPYLFERFYKADRSRSAGTGGSGLGLAIAAENARLLGGELGVRSEVGKGTTVRLWLPAGGGDDGDTPVTQR